MYPPISELSVTVSVSDSSGLISRTTSPASQSDAFLNLRNKGSYTVSVEARHDTTGPSTPKTISLISMHKNINKFHVIALVLSLYMYLRLRDSIRHAIYK